MLEKNKKKMICGDKGEDANDENGGTNRGLVMKKASFKNGKKMV